MDSWRLIAFNAVRCNRVGHRRFRRYQHRPQQPVNFRAPTADPRIGDWFNAPFTRLLERNTDRQSIIDYERDPRTIQVLDGVTAACDTGPYLERLRVNLEIQRRAWPFPFAVWTSLRKSSTNRVHPLRPAEQTTRVGPTAALDLLTALSDLRNTQDDFMSVS